MHCSARSNGMALPSPRHARKVALGVLIALCICLSNTDAAEGGVTVSEENSGSGESDQHKPGDLCSREVGPCAIAGCAIPRGYHCIINEELHLQWTSIGSCCPQPCKMTCKSSTTTPSHIVQQSLVATDANTPAEEETSMHSFNTTGLYNNNNSRMGEVSLSIIVSPAVAAVASSAKSKQSTVDNGKTDRKPPTIRKLTTGGVIGLVFAGAVLIAAFAATMSKLCGCRAGNTVAIGTARANQRGLGGRRAAVRRAEDVYTNSGPENINSSSGSGSGSDRASGSGNLGGSGGDAGRVSGGTIAVAEVPSNETWHAIEMPPSNGTSRRTSI